MPPARWSRERIISTLDDRVHRGLPITVSRVREQAEPLYAAARYYFGSWRAALLAAGLKISYTPRRLFSEEELLSALRATYRAFGNTLDRTLDRDFRKNGSGISNAIRYHFGSLPNARKAAGVPVTQGWTPERVLRSLRAEAVRGFVSQGILRQKNLSLFKAAEYHFGTWRNALRAAGLKAKWRQDHSGQSMKWTPENVLRILRDASRKGKVTIDPVRRQYAGIYLAAKRHYGSWWKALGAAGVPY